MKWNKRANAPGTNEQARERTEHTNHEAWVLDNTNNSSSQAPATAATTATKVTDARRKGVKIESKIKHLRAPPTYARRLTVGPGGKPGDNNEQRHESNSNERVAITRLL